MDYQLLINKAREKGLSDLELYVETNRSTSISIYNSKLDQYEDANTCVLSARGVYEGKMGTFELEDVCSDKMDLIIDEVIKSAKAISNDDPIILFEGSKEYPALVKEENDFDKISFKDKIEVLKMLEKSIFEANRLMCAVPRCGYTEEYNKIELINSKGLNLVKENVFAYILGTGVAKDGDSVKDGYDIQIVKRFRDIDVLKQSQKIVLKCVNGLNPSTVKSNHYRVMFDNKMTSSLLSAYSSIFSAEAVLRGLSLLNGRLGTKVFGENISIYDDPINDQAPLKSIFDDEGVASYKKTVVKNGVIELFLNNLATAKKMNVNPTGNGYKRDGGITVSPCNMYLQAGEYSYDEMVQKLENGVIITSLQGLHAGLNPVSGDFSLQASGFLVADGQIQKPITLFVVAGNIMSMLNNVVFIGNDLEFGLNPVSAPSIIVSSLMISGD